MKKGNNSGRKNETSKKKNIFRYSHIGIMLRFHPPMLIDDVCRVDIDKHKHTQMYIQSTHTM